MTIDINELRRHTRKDQMDSLISRLQRPGYDLQKEQAIQEAIVVLQQLNAERYTMCAKIEAMEKSVPEKVEVREDEGHIFSRGSYNEGYDNGWNDCCETILAAAPEAKP